MPDNRDKIRLEGDSNSLVAAVDRASRSWDTYNKTLINTINVQNNTQANFTKMNSVINNTTVNIKEATTASKGLSVSLGGMARLVGVQLIHRSISTMTRNLVEGAKQAVEVEKALAEVRTISQDNQLTLDGWFEGVKKLSNAYGTDLRDQIESAYQTLSNQVAEGADVFRFLEESNQFAAAAVTDSSTAVNLLTAAINSYGLEAEDARQVSAKFFKTIELGRVRASEMANSFGDVSVLASRLGVSLSEVLGLVSSLSIQGIKYNKVATQLRGLFSKMLKPTKEMTALFNEWGVATGSQAIETFGLIGVLERLDKAIDGNESTAAKLVPRMRGLTAVLGATGKNLELVRENIDAVTNSTETYNKAVDEVLNNAGKRADIAATRVKNAFLTNGRAILDFWTDVIGNVTGIYDDLDKAREKSKIGEAFRTEMHKMNSDFAESLAGRHREYLLFVANVNSAVNEQTKKELDSINTIEQASTMAHKEILRAIKATVDSGNDEFDRLSKNVMDANKQIINLVRQEDQTLFEWAQDTRNTAEQIGAITTRIAELDKKQIEARKEGNKKLFDSISKEILKLHTTRKKLDKSLADDNEKAMKKQLELAKKIEEAKITGAQKDAQLRLKLKGSKPKDRAKIEEQIHDNMVNTERAVTDLREELGRVEVLDRKRLDFNKQLKNEYEDQRKQLKLLAEEQSKLAKEKKQQLIIEEANRDRLKDAFKSFRGFDTEKDLQETDPKKLREAARQRRRTLQEILESSRDLGIDPSAFAKTSLATFKAQEELDKRADRLEKQDEVTKKLVTQNDALTESFKKMTEQLKNQEQSINKVNDARDKLLNLVTESDDALGADAKEAFRQIESLLKDVDLTTLSGGDQKNMIQMIDALSYQIINTPNALGAGAATNITKGEVAEQLGIISSTLKKNQDINVALGETQKAQERLKKLTQGIFDVEKKKTTEVGKQDTGVRKVITTVETLLQQEKALTEEYRLQSLELEKQNLIRGGTAEEKIAPEIQKPPPQNQAPVQNKSLTNVGDIKVNLNATGNLNYDAAQIGREIKRAVRRGIV